MMAETETNEVDLPEYERVHLTVTGNNRGELVRFAHMALANYVGDEALEWSIETLEVHEADRADPNDILHRADERFVAYVTAEIDLRADGWVQP